MARRAAEHPIVRRRLLDAARELFVRDGFAATGVAEICAAAGVTKGSFFHYFDSKDAIGAAALMSFGADLAAAFATAPFHAQPDPLRRIDGYIDFTIEMCRSSVLRQGCLVGMLAQELAVTEPLIRERCRAIFTGWAESLAELLSAAKTAYAPGAAWDAHGLAMHFVAVVEGALLLAKTDSNSLSLANQLEYFRSYMHYLLT